MTTDELIDNINSLTHHVKIMDGVDGNSGNEIDGKEGFFAFTDEDGDVICKYSANGYASDQIFRIDLNLNKFHIDPMLVRDEEFVSSLPKGETAKLFRFISTYLEEGDWLPTKEFRKKEIEEIKQEINDKQEDLQDLQNRLDDLEKTEG